METASSFSPAAISQVPQLPIAQTAVAPAPYQIGDPVEDVVVSLSPEAVAILTGAIEPGEAVAAIDESDDGNPLKGIARDPTGGVPEDGVFNLYGQVDIDGDGDFDGAAGAVDPDDDDGAGLDPTGEDDLSVVGQDDGSDDPEGLNEDERQVVAEMAARDAEVRAHEAAHMAAGGGLASGMSFSYQTGPDGKRYAVGGEVGIDTSPGKTPEETILKAQRIRAAALAPAKPSGQDRAVAAQAAQMEASARGQLAEQNQAEVREALDSIGGDDVRGPEAASEASEVGLDQSQTAEGSDFVPAPLQPERGAERDDRGAGFAASPTSDAGAPETLARFESGEAGEAAQYGLPAPDNALVAGPIDDSSVAFSFVR